MTYHRYAIYVTPRPGPLAGFGAAWLGWDAASGAPCPHPALPGLPRPVAEITAAPRRYGFHGTLKPPFRLAAGCEAGALAAALAAFCAGTGAVSLAGLDLARIGRVLALCPVGGTDALDALAAAVVARFDPFRAPPDAAELDRRRAQRLTTRQEAMLQRWGYPHVMEEFRFHMTLTGPLPPAELAAVEAALAPVLAPLLPAPFPIDALTLLGEDREGRFHQIARLPLSG
jgi:putative phosphonate metabolism protein